MRVETLALDYVSKEKIDQFLCKLGNQLVYYSVEYNAFLNAALTGTTSYCSMAFNENTLVGLVWFHVTENDEGVKICNSLPFFGGHGGVLATPSLSEAVRDLLLNEFVTFCEKADVASMLLVENLIDRNMRNLDPALKLELIDTRIGQMTPLPVGLADNVLEHALFEMFHVKTRNAVRKGLKHVDSFALVDTLDAWHWLEQQHTEGILALNGLPKSAKVFASLRESQLNTRLYVAGAEGRTDAGLVVILYGDCVEYFTPVSTPEAKSSQALSALIYLVMTELALSGYKLWNWGGTWRTQAGVYRFKSRFGADDLEYGYYGRLLDDRLLAVEPAALQKQFPYFYVRRY